MKYLNFDPLKEASSNERINKMIFGSVYPLYLAKVVKKGRTQQELDQVIKWLTGYTQKQLEKHISDRTNFETFFASLGSSGSIKPFK